VDIYLFNFESNTPAGLYISRLQTNQAANKAQ
jgi:hypothetical protein